MKKNYESMDGMKYGTEVGFWDWYYRGKYKELIAFYWKDKKDWLEELQKHYKELLTHKEKALKNIDHEKYIIKHSAKGLLAQLKAIENIFDEFNIDYKKAS